MSESYKVERAGEEPTIASEAPSGTRSRRVAVTTVLFTAILLIVATTIRQMWGFNWGLFVEFLPMTLSLVVASTAVIARPRHVSAWALFGISITSVVENFGYAYGLYPTGMAIGHLPLAYAALIMASALQPAKWVFIPLLFLAFPGGKLDRRRGTVALVAVAVPLAATLMVVFNPYAPYGPFEVAWRTAAREHGLLDVFRLAWTAFQAGMVAMITWVFVRAARASVVERQQAKWLAVGMIPLLVWEAVISVVSPDITTANYVVGLTVRLLAAVGVAISITKYRLFEIDRLISRTVLYGSMAALIAAAYALIVGFISAVAGDSSPSQAVSLVAAIGAALLLLPLQSRLRRMANVLVFGRRATPYESMSTFSRVLGQSLNADQVLPAVVDAVAQGTGAAWVRATVRSPQGDRVETYGNEAPHSARTIDVRLGEEVVGHIEVAKREEDLFTPTEMELLEDLAAQAGPAFRGVALTLELERRLDEITRQAADLRRSRERIVAAQDEERRRIERDLHDGVQQNLVSLAGQLRLLTRMLEKQPAEAKALADQLVAEAMDTLDEIRDLARGVFPQVLSDAGLVAALRAHVTKVPARVDLVVDQKVEVLRFDPSAEVAAYFCCLEALQNVAKHAAGAPAVVTLSVVDEQLSFSIADQGPGFDPEAAPVGVGLASMEDRLAAVGGTLMVSSSEGRGTVVSGSIPLRETSGLSTPSSDHDVVSG